jgi:putative spermidine/putrescine transport system ATP-binding protein
MLRLIAGLLRPSAGTVFVAGRDVTHTPPERRGIGMVFQQPLLFPHLNCVQNVTYPLRMHKVPDATNRAMEALDAFGVRSLAMRYAHELSGGQQQRVALARAFAVRPRVLLLDEPFGALDAPIRMEMRALFQQLSQKYGVTSVFVTHDREEAMMLGQTIATVHAGTIDAVGHPQQLYEAPPTVHTAQLIGETNVFPHTDGQSAWVIRPHRMHIQSVDCCEPSIAMDVPFDTAHGMIAHVVFVEGRYRCTVHVGAHAMIVYTYEDVRVGETVLVQTKLLDWHATRSGTDLIQEERAIDAKKNNVDNWGASDRRGGIRTMVARLAECVRPRRG